MSDSHYIIIAAALAASLILSHAYTKILSPLQDRYVPDWIWITVAIGDFLILITQAILEYLFLITPTSILTCLLMVAWGLPIIHWQLDEYAERRRRRRQTTEGTHHGDAKRSPRSP